MFYTDPFFVLLFCVLFIAAVALRNFPRIKEALIIAFSGLVIASWGMFDFGLFLAIVVANYFAACAIHRAGRAGSRVVLVLAIVFDISALAVFKYANFFIDNFAFITSSKISHFSLGIPLAISFYTFHIISYLIDLHSGRIKYSTFGRYLFYLSFFPHVIAGPIIRAWQLTPQIGKISRLRAPVTMGFHYLVTGYFLKTFAADNIGKGIDPVWQGSQGYALTAADHWLVAFLYYCQIYADFAGYSLMAIGMARMLGYKFPANFRSPMIATSLQEFWRRWHITLSRWLRDYLYIPLGGGRHGASRTALNIMATMLLGGLWHGAGWGFVVWGGMHGGGLVLERVIGRHRIRALTGRRVSWWFVTHVWIILAWVFFRTASLPEAVGFVKRMMALSSLNSIVVHPDLGFLLIFAIPVLGHHLAPFILREIRRSWLAPALGMATSMMLLFSLVVTSPSRVFIYFKF